jgi:hypothetical protein
MFHTSSLICYLEYIRYGCMSEHDEELALRQLLHECEHAPDNFTPMTNILFSLTDNLKRQHRYAEDEVIALRLLRLAREKNSYLEMVWGLNSVSTAQMNLGKREEAERHIRESIALSSAKKGPASPQAINLWVRLETWIRNWGEEETADQVKEEYQQLLKQLDVSEEESAVFESEQL